MSLKAMHVFFIVLSILVVGLLLTWTWRFRREFWHRNNVLLLLALLLLVAVFALKLTADRAWLPYALPLAAVGMLVTVLLDAGAAMVLTALVAVLAAAVNGAGLELAAYVLMGGIAGIVTVRRGERLAVFVQAGFAETTPGVVLHGLGKQGVITIPLPGPIERNYEQVSPLKLLVPSRFPTK